MQLNNAKKQLLGGTTVYFIGNTLAQIASLLLLRFVTGEISSDEYGYYNLIVTIGNLLTPILTLQMSDALFRYFIKAEGEEQKRAYYTNATAVFLVGSVLVFVSIFCINCFYPLRYPWLVALYIVSTNLYMLYQKMLRAMGKSVLFATLGLVKTVLFIVSQMILLFVFDMGGKALFVSTLFTTFLAILAIELIAKPYRYFHLKSLDRGVLKKMLIFSLPLVPNTALWWLSSSINSVIVTARLGLDVNGIYTVANKFSTVVTSISTVFMMAWQESAIKEYKTANFKKFQTETFNSYFILMLSAIAALIPLAKLAVPYLIDPSYYAAVVYVPFLLLATMFSSFSSYCAQIMTAQEKTKNIMSTTIFGAASNLVIVAVLINFIGLWAAVIGTLVSHLALTVVRLFFVRSEFTRDISYLRISLLFVAIAVGSVLYLYADTVTLAAYFVLMAILAFLFNREFIFSVLRLIFSKLKRKKAPKAN